jgi:hypothetical protein
MFLVSARRGNLYYKLDVLHPVKHCLLTDVFDDHLTSESLWPSGSPILMLPAYFYLGHFEQHIV